MKAHYTDGELSRFLQELDDAPVEVSGWEAQFIESNIDSFQFSPKQREAILKMIEKYGDRIGFQ